MAEFGVFRRVGEIDICYGGPFGKSQAKEHRKNLEKKGDFRNEEELRSRVLTVKPMEPGEIYLWWDGGSRQVAND